MTITISLVALAVSLFNLLYVLWRNRASLSVSSPLAHSSGGRYLHVVFDFVNKSSNPIAITQIKLLYDGHSIKAEDFEQLFVNKKQLRGSEVVKSNDYTTTSTPINLRAFEGKRAVLLFRSDLFKKLKPSCFPIKVVVSTNRKIFRFDMLTQVVKADEFSAKFPV